MYRRLLFAFLFFLLSGTLSAQDNFIAEGTGLGANRDEALMGAKRDAIEKGIGMVLLSQSEIENFQLKRDIVVTKTIGAVSKYDIISESRTSDGLIEIKIKAQLSKSAMRQDLAAFNILIESMDKPRVMVLIDENNKPLRIMKKPEYQDRKHLIRDLFRAGHPIVPFRLGIRSIAAMSI